MLAFFVRFAEAVTTGATRTTRKQENKVIYYQNINKMAYINIDIEDYLDEVNIKYLLNEIRRRTTKSDHEDIKSFVTDFLGLVDKNALRPDNLRDEMKLDAFLEKYKDIPESDLDDFLSKY